MSYVIRYNLWVIFVILKALKILRLMLCRELQLIMLNIFEMELILSLLLQRKQTMLIFLNIWLILIKLL